MNVNMSNSIFSRLLFALIFLPTTSFSNQFITPIEGVPYVDWFISNFADVDLTENGTAFDWNGGAITYDGHKGIDYALTDGFEQMDAGVEIYAASAGQVVTVEDGYFDRWSHENPNTIGMPSNVVEIYNYADDRLTRYFHIKKNSIVVEVGDQIVAGQLLGLVGSSGNSTGPHLHFELIAKVNNSFPTIATYTDAAQWWVEPLPYPTDVVFSGVAVDSKPNYSASVPTFDLAAGQTHLAHTWVAYFGYDASKIFDITIYNPSGSIASSTSFNGTDSPGRYTYSISYFLGSNTPLGTWRSDVSLNGSVIESHDFQVFDSSIMEVVSHIYISPSNPASVDFNFFDEDIIVHDGTGWSMYFDGSDVGLGGSPDLNAFHRQANGNLLLSFDTPVNLGGILYDDSDIILFTPTSLGATTSGTFSMYLDGSANGLTTIGEDIDAIAENSAGELIVSTLGSAQIPRPPFSDLTQQDDDLARRRNSDGLWLRYLDGSDIGLTFATEDVWGTHIDKTTGIVYITTLDQFNATGLNGDGNDIFTCTPGILGNATSCPLELFWDGDEYGLSGERIDALAIELVTQTQ